jgi:hypothetical protein
MNPLLKEIVTLWLLRRSGLLETRSAAYQLTAQQKTPNQTNIMPFDTINMEEITKARRKAIAESIRTISTEELKALGEKLFPGVDHPWREKFFGFVTENPGSTFHLATTHDGVQIIYCRDKDKGMWFLPGTGMGPMQPNGLGILKQIVEGR